jgi:hypothetical protein
MLLAAHRTVAGSGLTAVTVETVTLDPPSRMGFFRLLRGPVPHVIETFAFDETGDDPAQLLRRASAPTFGGSARPGVTWSGRHGPRPMAEIKTESEHRAQG